MFGLGCSNIDQDYYLGITVNGNPEMSPRANNETMNLIAIECQQQG
jgi:hypothetical protein